MKVKVSIGAFIGLFVFIIGWWLTGEPFPHERSWQTLMQVVLGLLCMFCAGLITFAIYSEGKNFDE